MYIFEKEKNENKFLEKSIVWCWCGEVNSGAYLLILWGEWRAIILSFG